MESAVDAGDNVVVRVSRDQSLLCDSAASGPVQGEPDRGSPEPSNVPADGPGSPAKGGLASADVQRNEVTSSTEDADVKMNGPV